MSGLAGVRWFDGGRTAAIADVRPRLATLAHRGPDGLFAATSGPCVLGVTRFITTPEDRAERPPIVTSRSATVCLDGRLDNIVDLRHALGLKTSEAPADVDVVAAAWEAWEASAFERLLGDFAVAVWDWRERRLWLARDAFGLRPLLYREYDGGFWWASELQCLARLGQARVNEGMVAEYLADTIRSETETLVEGVMRVPRASALVLAPDGRRHVVRYWTPKIQAVRTFRRPADAVEEFRAVFAPAVRARVRSDRPIALALSGGLDSSLIAAEAAALVRSGEAPAIEAFTLASPGAADETPYAQAAANHAGLPLTICGVGTASWQPIIDDAERALDMPQPPNCVAAHPLSDAIRARGFRVCLNGVGGNEWFSGYHFPFADHVRQLQWIQMAARMRALRRENRTYRPFHDLRLALWLQLPEALRQRLRRTLRLSRVPGWIQPGLAARVGLVERLRASRETVSMPTRQLQLMFEYATSADQMFFTEYTERINATFACEERSPFLDRRLVEWALTLPDDQRWHDGGGKAVLRRAAVPVLPPAIVQRGLGPDFSYQTADGLRILGADELVSSIARERDGWVDPGAIRRLWAQMTGEADRRGRGFGYHAWVLWLLVGTHLAARAIETCDVRSSGTALDVTVADCTIPASAVKEAV